MNRGSLQTQFQAYTPLSFFKIQKLTQWRCGPKSFRGIRNDISTSPCYRFYYRALLRRKIDNYRFLTTKSFIEFPKIVDFYRLLSNVID